MVGHGRADGANAAEAVEVVASFGHTIIDVTHVPVNGCYRVGTAPGVNLPLAALPYPSFPLVAAGPDDSWVFHWHTGIEGALVLDGQPMNLSMLGAPSAMISGAREIVLLPEARVCAQIGRVAIRVTRMQAPGSVVPRARIDRRPLLFAASSLAAHLMVVQQAATATPPTSAEAHRATSRPRLARIAKVALVPTPPVGLPPVSHGTHPAHRSKLVASTPTRPGAPNEPRERALERARTAGVLGSPELVAGLDRITGVVDLDAALSGLHEVYDEDAAQSGNFGMSGRRFDPMANCADCGTIATGPYKTVSSGRGAGDDYGLFRTDRGPEGRGGPEAAAPRSQPTVSLCIGSTPCVTSEGATLAGVTRQFKRRRAAIMSCYLPLAQVDPGLQGEVILDFEIDADGRVKRVRRQGPGTLADCVAGLVEKFVFRPAFGGTLVTYSMMFRPSS